VLLAGYLKRTGIELLLLITEVFICTLSSGVQGGKGKGETQNKNDLSDAKIGARHKISSGNQNKSNLKNTNLSSAKKFTNPLFTTLFGFLILGLLLFLSPKEAKAVSSWNNVELAKKVVENVAPIVSNQKQDTEAASIALASNDFIQKPLVVETEITQPEKPKYTVKSYVANKANGIHFFPYGYCTYYVSQKRTITWSGNAGTWLSGASRAGLKIGNKPQIGAIIVTSEGGYTGHVGYIEAINDDQITLSEMNYKGFGIVSSRTISAQSKFIKGYIY
jgi:surface antigen